MRIKSNKKRSKSSWLTPEDKKKEGVPSSGSSKYAVKPQVWLAVSYDAKKLYIHAKRKRKKRHGARIKPKYRLELKGVNSTELSYVVDEEFGQELQDAGVETVIVDNDRKAHSKMVQDAWVKFDATVGQVKIKQSLLDFLSILPTAW